MSTVARKVHVGRGRLWFGLFGGAVSWTVHLMLSYAVAEFGCAMQPVERGYLEISMVAWLELALTVATTLASGTATAVAYRIHRRLRSGESKDDAVELAERYIAWAGVLTSGTFTFIILFESIPILYYLHGC
jgi:hypothetical protein